METCNSGKPVGPPVTIFISSKVKVFTIVESELEDNTFEIESVAKRGMISASLRQLAEIEWHFKDMTFDAEDIVKMRSAIHEHVLKIVRPITPSRKEDPDYTLEVYPIANDRFRVSMVRLPPYEC